MVEEQGVILITGGSGKIGRVLVSHFLQKGWIVVATGRTQESLKKLEQSCLGNNLDRLFSVAVDFTDTNAVSSIISFFKDCNLKPHCLINNARSIDFLKIEEDGVVSRENFANELIVDIVIPYELTMKLSFEFPKILTRVINISSQYGLVAANPALYEDYKHQSPIHYSVAKAGVIHLTRELAVRLANQGIQVNCVAFGGIEGRVDKSFEARYAKLSPSNRMLRNDEVIGSVDFLSSSACSGMTGHTLVVDGGWSIW